MVVGDISTGTELAVIGGGPGGYVAAIRAAQLDVDVTLIEDGEIGGVCLNAGCIPSKALISATDVAHHAAHAEEMGIHAEPSVDAAALTDWKDGVVDRLTGGVEKLCKGNGVNLIEGRAEFADEKTLRVVHGGEGQGSETIEFEDAIVATGSRPIEVPEFPFGDERVWDSRDALSVSAIPDELVIIGAGYIGMELSTVFAKLGADVTVVEMLDEALPGFPTDISRPVRRRAEEYGVEFAFGHAASEYDEDGDGVVVTTETEDGETATHTGDRVIVAVGRQPVTETLNLDAIDLEPTEDGFLETDHQCRTALENVFAIGDVAGEPMLAHAASHEGEVAAAVVAGQAAALDHQAIPAAVFTDPEIGVVGLGEEEARDAGFDPAVGTFSFDASGRAMTTGETEGFVKVIADSESGFILGGQIVGPEASELIAELGLAVEMSATLEDLAATVHTHPTLSEATMEATKHALGQAIHRLNR
ncbi:MAG: dihydrolipoyl dehydrogenase [Halobacteriaceae archaeon]